MEYPIDTAKHLSDFRRVIKGVETFVGLDFDQIRAYCDKHEEDKLCDLPHPSGKGMVLCTRDAYDAIYSMAERHLTCLSNAEDYSAADMAQAIRDHILRASVEESSDEAIIERTLRDATLHTRRSHCERTFHLPCVLVSSQTPPHLRFGPVSFASVSAFLDLKRGALSAYVDESRNREAAAAWVERFKTYAAGHGWIASVTIPPCARSVSQARAEQTATTAINLLRLFIGAGHARDMRLAHSFSPSPSNYDFLVEADKRLDIWSTRKVPGAFVEDNWYPAIRSRGPAFWSQGEHLLHACTKGGRSEMAARVLDALSWFGEAALETVPGTQIAKFEAALERLTVTGPFRLHLFCACVAILAHGREEDIEQCYWNAFNIHVARSQTLHGVMSPTSPVFLKSLSLAHDVTRTALFRGLEIHCFLDDPDTLSTLDSLRGFYTKQMSRHALLFSKLKKELNVKRAEYR